MLTDRWGDSSDIVISEIGKNHTCCQQLPVFLQPSLPALTGTMQSAYPTPKGPEDDLMSLQCPIQPIIG